MNVLFHRPPALVTGFTYQVQAATNLTSPVAWQTLSTNVADTNGVFQYTDTQATNFHSYYYRSAQP